jgi:DNA polymerase-1
MMAMLKLARNAQLRALGWRMLLQIHDEVILEGPAESAPAALAAVEADMTQPFAQPLLVALAVDAKVVDTWYEAK